ncbi:DUF305 domain-containing protein [Helicobacter mastomyrinus]|uniref:DUF305 domain-containing protein n=3 Tax=Helicobacter TaxID=209 RepID=A0ABZ3F7H7_9HELI
MRILQPIFLYVMCVYVLMAADTNTPPHTMQHHEQILQSTSSPSLTEQMMNLMHESMMEVPFVEEDNLDFNYLSNMIPHHQGAIEAAELFLKHSKNQKLRAIAQNIIKTQQAEIATYELLITQLKEQKKLYSPKEVTLYNAQAKADMESMLQAMNEVALNQSLNRVFLAGMIPHHQGAITASKQILQYTQNAEIKAIAQQIISTQEAEIETFQTLLQTIR